MKKRPSCSLFIWTYNCPEALETTLLSVFKQSVVPKEIVICDAGSGASTGRAVEKLTAMSPIPLLHVWHPDQGGRKAAIMNRGVAATTGEYLITIDQDVILHKDFVKDHLNSCEKGRFLTGDRCFMKTEARKETQETRNVVKPFDMTLSKEGIRRLRLPLLQKLMSFFKSENSYQYVSGFNMSFWRNDFLKVNGYDEDFKEPEQEDTDLALRLINSGIKMRFMRFAAIQLHLYPKKTAYKPQVFDHPIATQASGQKRTIIERGIQQHLLNLDLPSEVVLVNTHVPNHLESIPA